MKRMQSCWALVLVLSSIGLGCSAEGTQSGDPLGEIDGQQAGRLRLPLVTAAGETFRLRAASFTIRSASSTTVATLDSESEPGATELSVELSPGAYDVALGAGWFLERLSDDGSVSGVNAALLTPNPTRLDVRDSEVTELVYTFSTTDGVITLGSGAVSISVDVVRPEALAACNLASDYYGSGCPSGQTCLMADEGGPTFCATPGPLPVGAPCESQQCVAGAQCLAPEEGAPRMCTRFCNPQALTFGCNCAALSFDAERSGICIAPPPEACDLLTQSGCPDGESCRYVGGNFGSCGVPGALGRGEPCVGEVCAAGLDCYGDDPESQAEGRCLAICNLDDPSCMLPEGAWYSSCNDVSTGRAGRCFDYF
jgi:hypothetical protein